MWCLYYSWTILHFGRIAEKYKLVKHEEENPLTEEIDNNEFTNKKVLYYRYLSSRM
jgi:hypothetical protein